LNKEATLEISPSELGTLELDGMWVPYVDMYDVDFVPTRLRLAHDEYAFESSILERGHGAVLPPKLRELRAAGKKPLLVERGKRYYIYVTPP
jgi:hypothetical protein